jgi:uncharacterized HAD superfamily protein/adenine/guanine phosphoribosyltransferase-like PRPP-binding protein
MVERLMYNMETKMNFVSTAQLNQDIIDNIHKIPHDIEVIIGIPRSGMLVASIIALYLNKPLVDIDGFIKGEVFSVGRTKNTNKLVKNSKNIHKGLVVDDSINSGESMQEARNKLRGFKNLIYMSAYAVSSARNKVDLFFRIIEQPRLFEWNFMHHICLLNACLDIDGVVCVDPTPEENDDGEKYREFILNATPKYIPTRKVGWFVTSRLEKYRKETEIWLKKYNIEYEHLIMLDLPSAEERRRLNIHGKYKASIFKKIKGATYFIESDKNQAKMIFDLTGKNVICTQDMKFFSAIENKRLHNEKEKILKERNILKNAIKILMN